MAVLSKALGLWPLAWQHNSQWVKATLCPFSSLLFRHVERNNFIKVWIISRGCCFSAFSCPTLTAPHLRSLLVMAPFCYWHQWCHLVGIPPVPENNIASHRAGSQPSWACETCSPGASRGLFLAAHPRPRRGPAAPPQQSASFSKVQARRRRGGWSWAMPILVGSAGFSPGRHKSLQEASHLINVSQLTKPPKEAVIAKEQMCLKLHPFIWWPPEIGERFILLIMNFFPLNLVILLFIRKEKNTVPG